MGKFNLNQILNDASKRAAPGGGGQTAPASRPAQIERLSVFDLVPSEDNFYSMNDIEELKSKIELAVVDCQNVRHAPGGQGLCNAAFQVDNRRVGKSRLTAFRR